MIVDALYCTPFPAARQVGVTAAIWPWRTSVRVPNTATMNEAIEAVMRKIDSTSRNKVQRDRRDESNNIT